MRQNYENDIANLNKWKNNNNVMFPTFFKYQYRSFFSSSCLQVSVLFSLSGSAWSVQIRVLEAAHFADPNPKQR